MNIHQKLIEVRKSIGSFTKDADSYGYSYVSGSQVLGKIQEKMNELGVMLMPAIQDQSHEVFNYMAYDKKQQKQVQKTDFLVYGNMTYTWVNAEDPNDKIEVPFFYTGQQDDISKAFGSGLTYSERYFLLKFFSLPTDRDDPDSRDTSGKSDGQRSKGGKASEKQLNFIDSLLKRKVSDKFPKETLYANLKERIGTQEDMENWTADMASKAISILNGQKGA